MHLKQGAKWLLLVAHQKPKTKAPTSHNRTEIKKIWPPLPHWLSNTGLTPANLEAYALNVLPQAHRAEKR